MTNPHDKAIEAAAKALWELADDEVGWEASKADPKMEPQIEWTLESIRAAIAAYERAMWRPIEEAPKKWAPILAFDPALAEGERLQVVAWNDIGNYWQSWIDDAPDPDPVVFRPLPPVPEGE